MFFNKKPYQSRRASDLEARLQDLLKKFDTDAKVVIADKTYGYQIKIQYGLNLTVFRVIANDVTDIHRLVLETPEKTVLFLQDVKSYKDLATAILVQLT